MIEGEGDAKDRLRAAPVGRFAGQSHVFDLGAALAALRAEPHEALGGHRQVTIFHRSPVAHVLFSFEPGSRLDKHAANGLVVIHVLDGHLRVHADGRDHELRAGHVLILNPEMPHDVLALEASAMLLTVHMEGRP